MRSSRARIVVFATALLASLVLTGPASATDWERRFTHGKQVEKKRAVEKLGRLGKRGFRIAKAMFDKHYVRGLDGNLDSEKIAQWALLGMARAGQGTGPEAAESVREVLGTSTDDRTLSMALDAAELLGEHGYPLADAVGRLIPRRLFELEPQVVDLLGSMAVARESMEHEKTCVKWLIHALGSFERRPAMVMSALGRFGKDAAAAAPKVVRFLESKDATVKKCALNTLYEIDVAPPELEPHAPMLRGLTEDEHAHIRRCAVSILGNMKSSKENVAAIGKCMLEDDDVNVRTAALYTLREATWPPEHIGPVIDRGIASARTEARLAVCRLLAWLDFAEGAGIDWLVHLTKDPVAEIRVAACDSLALHGKEAERALPALAALAEDPSNRVRLEAADAVKSIREQVEKAEAAE